jgi:hypothetical protein
MTNPMPFLFYVGNYAQYECCFRVGVFEDETCFEQVNALFVTSLNDNIMSLNHFLVYIPQANLFGDYVCKCKLKRNCYAFICLMCHRKK